MGVGGGVGVRGVFGGYGDDFWVGGCGVAFCVAMGVR